tara:strand:- start:496 stop:729 length:234 start_codon:yes stop_codon:yes gene_type:complete
MSHSYRYKGINPLERAKGYILEYCEQWLDNEWSYKHLSHKDVRILQDVVNALYELSEFTPPKIETIWDEIKKDKETE